MFAGLSQKAWAFLPSRILSAESSFEGIYPLIPDLLAFILVCLWVFLKREKERAWSCGGGEVDVRSKGNFNFPSPKRQSNELKLDCRRIPLG